LNIIFGYNQKDVYNSKIPLEFPAKLRYKR